MTTQAAPEGLTRLETAVAETMDRMAESEYAHFVHLLASRDDLTLTRGIYRKDGPVVWEASVAGRRLAAVGEQEAVARTMRDMAHAIRYRAAVRS